MITRAQEFYIRAQLMELTARRIANDIAAITTAIHVCDAVGAGKAASELAHYVNVVGLTS